MKIFTQNKDKELCWEENIEAEKKVVEFTAYLFNGKRKKVFGVLEWDNHKMFLDANFDVSSMIGITDKKHNSYSIKGINTNGGKYFIKINDNKEDHFKALHEIDFDFFMVR